MEREGHEQVVFCRDRSTGLRAIVAIHDTTLGPGLGGIRMRAYASESEALTDVLRLSEAMSLKASLAGLDRITPPEPAYEQDELDCGDWS